jgi:hypothetical protein
VVKRCLRSWLFVFLLLFLLPLPFHSEKVEGIEKEEGKTSAFKGPFGGGGAASLTVGKKGLLNLNLNLNLNLKDHSSLGSLINL